MLLTINGEERELALPAADATVLDVVTVLSLPAGRVALEHNGAVVPRARWAQTPVRPGDVLELVTLVGGG